MSLGSTNTDVEWKFSLKAGKFERMHGKATAMASATANPKPSLREGSVRKTSS